MITKAKVRIAMDRYGERGWVFCLRWTDQFTSEDKARSFCTNHQGEGLWQGISMSEGQQLYGTCQFDLSKERKAAYQQIRRWALRSVDYLI